MIAVESGSRSDLPRLRSMKLPGSDSMLPSKMMPTTSPLRLRSANQSCPDDVSRIHAVVGGGEVQLGFRLAPALGQFVGRATALCCASYANASPMVVWKGIFLPLTE